MSDRYSWRQVIGNAVAFQSIVDPRGMALFWKGWVKRTNLDGSDLDTLVTLDFGYLTGLALDVPGGKIYWTHPSSNYSVARVQRANLDGSGIKDIVTSTSGGFTDITLEPSVQEQVTSPETLSGNLLQVAVSNGSPSFSDGGS